MPTTALTLNLNQVAKVFANITDSNNHQANSDVIWTSTNSAVALVQFMADDHRYSFVTAVSIGTATVTATSNAITADFAVNVVDPASQATSAITLSVVGGPHGAINPE